MEVIMGGSGASSEASSVADADLAAGGIIRTTVVVSVSGLLGSLRAWMPGGGDGGGAREY